MITGADGVDDEEEDDEEAALVSGAPVASVTPSVKQDASLALVTRK